MQGFHFNFEAGLVLATVVTGLLWALDRFYWARRRGEDQQANWAVEFGRSFFPVILAVLLLRSFVVEPFRIPSGSMVPTLLVGDFILVNKFAYGLRLPVLHTEILDLGAPQRGDVAVFRYPNNPAVDYIKRIVGVPGDTVSYHDRQLFINGKPVPLKLVGPYSGPGMDRPEPAQLFLEKLGEDWHKLVDVRSRGSGPVSVVVPAGDYFVMGDNRDNSADSRYWGFVPESALVGPAFVIWMSIDWDAPGIRFGRIGQLIE
ncbi:MAG: signal peptidase I [Salinisphaera sp.]|nr:signal peptidase I [Salinisphaera sp.]MDN5938328.1 signal peptidase I [Salinisphaera sp.]